MRSAKNPNIAAVPLSPPAPLLQGMLNEEEGPGSTAPHSFCKQAWQGHYTPMCLQFC